MIKKTLLAVLVVGMAANAYSLNIQSEVFGREGYIPARYSCDDKDCSPSLSWSELPQDTKSLVLICEDPDAPFQIWVHWVVFNIPIHVKDFEENISPEKLATAGILQGINDFGNIGYGGPCPPPGKPHRYYFKLYALDTTLSLQEGATKKEVASAMQGHILAETELVGVYQR